MHIWIPFGICLVLGVSGVHIGEERDQGHASDAVGALRKLTSLAEEDIYAQALAESAPQHEGKMKGKPHEVKHSGTKAKAAESPATAQLVGTHNVTADKAEAVAESAAAEGIKEANRMLKQGESFDAAIKEAKKVIAVIMTPQRKIVNDAWIKAKENAEKAIMNWQVAEKLKDEAAAEYQVKLLAEDREAVDEGMALINTKKALKITDEIHSLQEEAVNVLKVRTTVSEDR
jgi:hypothetical protein